MSTRILVRRAGPTFPSLTRQTVGLLILAAGCWLAANNEVPADEGSAGGAEPTVLSKEPSPAKDTGQPEDYDPSGAGKPSDSEDLSKLSPAELKQLAVKGRIRKAVDQKFRRQPRVGNRFARVDVEDCFVAARFEMPLTTRMLEVRFEVIPGVDKAVDQVTDYLISTPQAVVRDFLVVARYESLAEAEEGLLAARQQYDRARAYQSQLLAYIQAQQRVQVSSMQRC